MAAVGFVHDGEDATHRARHSTAAVTHATSMNGSLPPPHPLPIRTSYGFSRTHAYQVSPRLSSVHLLYLS
jgi:hypothetical protein